PFEQLHGKITSFGYRFGKFAYSTDVSELSDFAFKMLEGVEVWLVDALRYEPHPTHSHLERTLSWIDRVKPKQAFLTHMTWDLDYETLCKDLPDHIRPAFDGMEINL
ncbi:MAG: MBL fold metallo-hydrolase, partial [Sphingomonadales bacterium]